MSNDRVTQYRDFDFGFAFESFGVTIGIECDDPVFLTKLREMVARAFGGTATIFEESTAVISSVFGIAKSGELFRLFKNGSEIASGIAERNLLKYLNSVLRLEVAEFAKGWIFVHAGVVAWRGEAIVFPARSFSGKSTLTAELLRNGAEYYSDEYAVIGPDGFVRPFPRHISMRYFGATREREVPPNELGANVGVSPIPIGMVLLTKFEKGAVWKPETLSPGSGIMEIVPNTLTMHQDPAFSLKVLDLVARRAIMVKSPRGDVKKFAKFLLAFFDKHSKLFKMT